MHRRKFISGLAASSWLGTSFGSLALAEPLRRATPVASESLDNHRVKINVGELTAVIGDNESSPLGEPWGDDKKWPPVEKLPHRSGYNGLWSLESVHQPENLFLPWAAGMNFEFVYDGYVGAKQFDNRSLIFEPRSAPMSFRQLNERTVQLHQPPTPFWGLESWTELVVRKPYYIDMKFEFMPTRKTWHYDWLSLMWASYIYEPFWKESWLSVVDEDGNPVHLFDTKQNSVIRKGDPLELKTTEGWWERVLSDGKLQFTKPYCWGVHQEMLFMYLVDTPHRLGFWSGGFSKPRTAGDACPWDWHITVVDPEPNKRYRMRTRLVYTKYQGPGHPGREFKKWRSSSY